MKKFKTGFTMVELMIVVALLGILGVAGVGSYTNSMKVSRDAKRKTDLESIRQALEMYKSENPLTGYPDVAAAGNAKNILGCSTCPLTTPTTYISSTNFPQDPLNSASNNYYYYNKITDNTYTLGTILENAPASNNCLATDDCNAAAGTQRCNFCVTQP